MHGPCSTAQIFITDNSNTPYCFSLTIDGILTQAYEVPFVLVMPGTKTSTEGGADDRLAGTSSASKGAACVMSAARSEEAVLSRSNPSKPGRGLVPVLAPADVRKGKQDKV